jgi:hypothetical protein
MPSLFSDSSYFRLARPSKSLKNQLSWYDTNLGFKPIGSFEGHDGFDGLTMSSETPEWHFEFTTEQQRTFNPSSLESVSVGIFSPRLSRQRLKDPDGVTVQVYQDLAEFLKR